MLVKLVVLAHQGEDQMNFVHVSVAAFSSHFPKHYPVFIGRESSASGKGEPRLLMIVIAVQRQPRRSRSRIGSEALSQ